MRPSSACPPRTLSPASFSGAVHSMTSSIGQVAILPCLTYMSTREPPTSDHRSMLGNSLDPFPSGPLYGGRVRQTQALAKPQEKDIFSLSTATTRCFPACLAEKPALSVSSPSCQNQHCRRIGNTFQRGRAADHSPFPWEFASRFKGSLYWSGPA